MFASCLQCKRYTLFSQMRVNIQALSGTTNGFQDNFHWSYRHAMEGYLLRRYPWPLGFYYSPFDCHFDLLSLHLCCVLCSVGICNIIWKNRFNCARKTWSSEPAWLVQAVYSNFNPNKDYLQIKVISFDLIPIFRCIISSQFSDSTNKITIFDLKCWGQYDQMALDLG